MNSSVFKENKGYSSSNAVCSDGLNFYCYFSIFISNKPADNLPLAQSPGYGGAMSILAHKISIRFNIFEDNIKGKAGALSFFYPSSSAYKGVLTIEKCLFEENQALFSGGIYVHVVSQIIVLILNNIFLSNYAKQSKLIFFSKAFIIYSLFDERRCCLKFGGTF